MSTPAGRLSLFSASIVLAVACTMSIKPFVGADFELLASLLVDMRAGQHRIALDPRRQRNRPMHFAIGPFGGIDDLRRALIQAPSDRRLPSGCE